MKPLARPIPTWPATHQALTTLPRRPALPHRPTGGRLLFAATEDGAVRAYRLPLAPGAEHQALRCGAAPISRLAATRDESLLFAATADGCLLALDVKDRDAGRFLTCAPARAPAPASCPPYPAAAAGHTARLSSRHQRPRLLLPPPTTHPCRRREGEGLPWAEEVLVARGDIEERRERMAELEAQVRGARGWLAGWLAAWVDERQGLAGDGGWLAVGGSAADLPAGGAPARDPAPPPALATGAGDARTPAPPPHPAPPPRRPRSQVAEAAAQAEYQLKLRDLALGEKVGGVGWAGGQAERRAGRHGGRAQPEQRPLAPGPPAPPPLPPPPPPPPGARAHRQGGGGSGGRGAEVRAPPLQAGHRRLRCGALALRPSPVRAVPPPEQPLVTWRPGLHLCTPAPCQVQRAAGGPGRAGGAVSCPRKLAGCAPPRVESKEG